MHIENPKITKALFKYMLTHLHNNEPLKYQMSRGSSKFKENVTFGINSDEGYYVYLHLEEEE